VGFLLFSKLPKKIENVQVSLKEYKEQERDYKISRSPVLYFHPHPNWSAVVPITKVYL